MFFTISFIKDPREEVKTEKNIKLVARIIGAKHGSVSPLKQWRGATAVAPGCLYLEAAVATVFEIATFPLAKVLHSRSIENGFFSF